METRAATKSWQPKSMQIALAVLAWMREKGMTQVQLAAALGVSPQYVNKMLKGSENLTLETICKLEEILAITLVKVPGKK